jgi:hypothetical protein
VQPRAVKVPVDVWIVTAGSGHPEHPHPERQLADPREAAAD